MSKEITLHKNALVNIQAGSLPLVIAEAGEKTSLTFLEFFTNSIANEHTRRAYARAAVRFFSWCEQKNVGFAEILPPMIGIYFRELEEELSTPSVKQELSAIKKLFDFFVNQGVMPFNKAATVRGPKYSPREGKTQELSASDVRTLFDSMTGVKLKDCRDRAILGLFFYQWQRVGAVINLKVGDYRYTSEPKTLTFKEKGGKIRRLPLHHKAAQYLNGYISTAQIDLEDKVDKKLPMFRTINRYRELTTSPMTQPDMFRMIRKRAKEANIKTNISNHTGRKTGITTFLDSGGLLEQAQDIAGHADPRTTRLYDARRKTIEQSEIERVQY